MRSIALVVLLAGCGGTEIQKAPDVSHSTTTTPLDQIAAENKLPGSTGWEITNPAMNREIEGYIGEPSAEAGATIDVKVSTNPPSSFTWAVYRIGWYGGAGGRELASGGPIAGTTQPGPSFDPATGLVEVAWKSSFSFPTVDEHGVPWTTGVYLIVLANAAGLQQYAIFVLRDPTRSPDVLVQLPTATWQAYNFWGGESLYMDSRGLPGGKAVMVSYDRPYDSSLSFGAGLFPSKELPLAQWLERYGYDVGYQTSSDTTVSVGKPKIFIAVAHDEYATLDAMLNLEAARDKGTNLVFLTGDSFAWQVRFDGHHQICWKDRYMEDPLYGVDNAHLATLFRNPLVGHPENELLGIMSSGEASTGGVDWVVADASSWVYAGTGLKTGDHIPNLVGYEWDSVNDNGHTPAGIDVLAASPVPTEVANATVYESKAGSFVFAAGTINFVRHLDDVRVAKILSNLLERAGAKPE